jgi:ABC-type lipoprotein release transport system permease subunit
MSLLATRLIGKLLFHVGATDVATYVVVVAVILGTAAGACLVPSRRALRTDPASVFRAA